MKLFQMTVLLGAAVALAACGSDSTATGDTATGGGGGGATYEGGMFQLTTHAVDDKCLDGGLSLLFMPDGAGTPYDLSDTTEFPATADLPKTYDISLQAPFSNMTVTVEANGDGKMKVVDAKQTGVAINKDQYPNCTGDMTFNIDITVDSPTTLSLNAKISVDKWTGDDCPSDIAAGIATDGCLVTLDMKGAKVQ